MHKSINSVFKFFPSMLVSRKTHDFPQIFVTPIYYSHFKKILSRNSCQYHTSKHSCYIWSFLYGHIGSSHCKRFQTFLLVLSMFIYFLIFNVLIVFIFYFFTTQIMFFIIIFVIVTSTSLIMAIKSLTIVTLVAVFTMFTVDFGLYFKKWINIFLLFVLKYLLY